MNYAFGELFDNIFHWIVIGIIAAAAIQVLLPPELFTQYFGNVFLSMLVMLVISVPLYVCAEASTPIAAALIAQGLNPGAGLVLLLAGPATNIGAVGVLRRELGLRAVVVYLDRDLDHLGRHGCCAQPDRVERNVCARRRAGLR